MNNKILIVGDFFPVPSNFELYKNGNIKELLGDKLCSYFDDSCLTICNLEGALTDHAEKSVKTGPSLFAPTKSVKTYKNLGVNCCCLANNHITDAGHQGVIDTINILQRNGIDCIGAGRNINNIPIEKTYNVAGLNIGIYNVAETMYNAPTENTGGAYLYDEYVVCKQISDFKRRCDYLIVIYHGGAEKFRYPSPEIRKRFHRMADGGADMIISQHTHCVGCEEYYNGSYLLYGQGNFLFRSFNNEFTDTGLILELEVENQTIRINKHLVRAHGDKVRYDEKQDLTDFLERSEKIANAEFIEKEFQEYCFENMMQYLTAVRGKVFLRKVFAKFCPYLYRRLYTTRQFNRNQLLFIIHMLRSEQNRETALTGFLEMYKREYGQ